MGEQQVKKQLIDTNSGRDFISHLPQPIIENILVLLRTEEAVRTCVLSKEWRYAWCTVPKLVIFEKHNVDEGSDYDCSKYVDMLLSNHKGPINKFTLCMKHPDFEDLDQWINVLGSKGVQDLHLAFNTLDGHFSEVPPSFFSCFLDLTNLDLGGCMLDMPQVFGGFKLLRNIELDTVTLVGGDIEKLVSSCPLLEALNLVDWLHCLGNLVIRSQSLEKLTIDAYFKHLLLETPKLFAFNNYPEWYDHDDETMTTVQGQYLANFNGIGQYYKTCCNFIVVNS
jgi:hypothetical protein